MKLAHLYEKSNLSREEYEKIVSEISGKYPQLNAWGASTFPQQNVEEDKKYFYSDEAYKEFKNSIAYLSTQQTIKTFRSYVTSYGYKHRAEDKYHCYITNGVFILASIYISQFSDLKIEFIDNFPNTRLSLRKSNS